ncbi:50S ribosomal protein L28 [Nymphaea thermarum]|nr:50S ribosomal protein L28 [Nymphaea thermarum]
MTGWGFVQRATVVFTVVMEGSFSLAQIFGRWQGSTIANDVSLILSYCCYDSPPWGRVCPFTGKKANRANKVSFSNHKTKKLQFVNLQYKKVWWEAGKSVKFFTFIVAADWEGFY